DAKRNAAPAVVSAPLAFLPLTGKSGVALPEPALNTIPVGFPCAPPTPGMVTTRPAFFLPVPSYSVDLPVPLSATQTNPCGLKATPQPLTRSPSAGFAVGTEPSDASV